MDIMTIDDVFGAINNRLLEGIMVHDQLTAYFDFLNLHGYKRQQEYQTIKESESRRKLVGYYINHYSRLLPSPTANFPVILPSAWFDNTKQQVEPETKRNAVKDAFDKWNRWEIKTKALYTDCLEKLIDLHDASAACEVRELLCDVADELARVERLQIELSDIDYDLPTIYSRQPVLHKKYKKKIHDC